MNTILEIILNFIFGNFPKKLEHQLEPELDSNCQRRFVHPILSQQVEIRSIIAKSRKSWLLPQIPIFFEQVKANVFYNLKSNNCKIIKPIKKMLNLLKIKTHLEPIKCFQQQMLFFKKNLVLLLRSVNNFYICDC